MASAEAIARARDLLEAAATCDRTKADERLRRNLLIAAALREVLPHEPVVVGGTAEDFWTADEYHETDVDLVTWPLQKDEQDLLRELGFAREGRHWVHGTTGVPIEIPDSRLAGDLSRVRREQLGSGVALIISAEDLYLDRVRQATMSPGDTESVSFKSALAIAAANYDRMDWTYIDRALSAEKQGSPTLMKKLDAQVRRTLLRRLSAPRKRDWP